METAVNTAATIPPRIQLRPRALVGLLGATVIATAGITWAITSAEADGGAIRSRDVPTNDVVLAGLTPTAAEYVRGIMALTPEQLAAGFGREPVRSTSPIGDTAGNGGG
jgi:hypothetical protein